jgi:cytochrome c peroxidase
MRHEMRQKITKHRGAGLAMFVVTLLVIGVAYAQDSGTVATSYSPVDIKEGFASIMARMKAGTPEIMKRQMALLDDRYDRSNRPAKGVTMSRGKAVQEGVKTFPLRGIKGSPPYLHDSRLLTLEDTVDFFNLILQAKL